MALPSRDSVQKSGSLATFGNDSRGILAQAIGGGGGNGSATSRLELTNDKAEDFVISVGGAAGDAASGGIVEFENSAAINVSGLGSRGFFTQSVGGGGGQAGNVLMGAAANFGANLPMSSVASKSNGIGGDVVVATSSGNRTKGNSSVGMFAQSGGWVREETTDNPTGA